MLEDLVGQKFKMSWGEVVFRHEEALFVLISKPVRKPFDDVFGRCPGALSLALCNFPYLR